MLYLLKFSQPLGSDKHKAQYYLGWVECHKQLEHRLRQHRAGQGAAITRAAVERGYELHLVGTMPGDRKEERRLKSMKNHKRIAVKFEEKNERG